MGDEVSELGYVDMFTDMFRSIDEGRAPRETFYDGYVVNAVMDACYRSAGELRQAASLFEWRGGTTEKYDRHPRALRGPGGHQARAAARRPREADPQGPRHG